VSKNISKNKANPPVITVLFGGEAGDGAREAGANFGRLLTRLGYSVFASSQYPSLIRGGHNFCRVSFSAEEISSDYQALDYLVALDSLTSKLHTKELNKNGLTLFDLANEKPSGKNSLGLPLRDLSKELNTAPIMRAALSLGALCYLLNLPLKTLEQIFQEVFPAKFAPNVALAKRGFEIARASGQPSKKLSSPLKKSQRQILVDGNLAFSQGMLAGGLEFYLAYPMTPASSIQHHLAKMSQDSGLKVVQPENEITVINMALGCAYAGKRAAIGTSGGGFGLMHEGYSLAGMAEIPLLVALSQRPGPATGVPTYTAQADLSSIRYAGHGEFPRLVLAPGDAQEAYELGAQALGLAWKFQMPVLVLLDKHLSESLMTVDYPKIKIKLNTKIWDKKGEYKRYKFNADGVSPLAYPGTPNTAVKVNSYEHDEAGIATEDTEMAKKMQEKRFRKLQTLIKERKKFDTVKVFGQKDARTAVVFWGSTKGAVLEAAKLIKKPLRLVQVLWLEPLDENALLKSLNGVKEIVGVEGNFTGQLCQIIKEKTGTVIKKQILQYDGRQFEPRALAEKIERLLAKK